MKKRTIGIVSLLLITILSILIFSCDINKLSNGEGSLLISLNNKGMARSLWIPEYDMEIASYKIIGKGPGDNKFNAEVSEEGSFFKEDLIAGEWKIDVEGYNTAKEKIAESESLYTKIIPNKNSKLTAILAPLGGEGTFKINIDWEATKESLSDPTVKLIFKDKFGKTILKQEAYRRTFKTLPSPYNYALSVA